MYEATGPDGKRQHTVAEMPKRSACTAPPSTTTSARSADMADSPQGPPRHAGRGRPPGTAPPEHRHRRRDRAARRRRRPGGAPGRYALPAAAPGPACSRRRLRAAVLIWHRLSARVPPELVQLVRSGIALEKRPYREPGGADALQLPPHPGGRAAALGPCRAPTVGRRESTACRRPEHSPPVGRSRQAGERTMPIQSSRRATCCSPRPARCNPEATIRAGARDLATRHAKRATIYRAGAVLAADLI
jgi:hypothetical protein